MAEILRGTRPEITFLLEEASHPQILNRNGLLVEITPKQINGEDQKISAKLFDISSQYRCAEIEVTLKEGKVVASMATLDQAYTALSDKQRALIIANIFHYAEITDPTIRYHFKETIDREKEEIQLFKNYIRNSPPELFRQLERALR